MTQLGGTVSTELLEIRKALDEIFAARGITGIDANSITTGRDFLDKIWKQILAVPMGIAILTREMQPSTIGNIYYELGLLDALGKETVVIKTSDFKIPSDFLRTEYISFHTNFERHINQFFDNIFERELHYSLMSDLMKADPVLSIDYLRRAFLISGDSNYISRASEIFDENMGSIDKQSRFFIENFLNTQF